ncbi:MAG: T9SS type A sorting domain-containing protein [Ferruginibacter sp.]
MKIILPLLLLLISFDSFSQGCPAGKYRNAAGNCVTCPPGTYCPGGNPALSIPCSAGRFQPNSGASSCINCPSGTYQANSGATNCAQCSAGTFQAGTGSTTCNNCAAGSFQPNTGSSSCLNCPAGTFQANTGSTNCPQCPAGTFQASTGASTCNNCAAGTFQSNAGSTNCLDCPAGTFQSGTGSANCVDCPAGTYQPATASIDCVNCPPGTTSFPGSTDITDCNIVVPVNLLYFNAEIFAKGVWLTWATAQEVNNDHFEIQRSNGGTAFVTIGQLRGFGNSQVTSYYYFTDSLPLIGLNLYRLKQVDRDGHLSFSPIKQIMYNGKGVTTVSPNPAINYITVNNDVFKIDQVNIYNSAGKLMLSEKINQNRKKVNINSLIPGNYYVEVLMQGKRFTEKIIKR